MSVGLLARNGALLARVAVLERALERIVDGLEPWTDGGAANLSPDEIVQIARQAPDGEGE